MIDKRTIEAIREYLNLGEYVTDDDLVKNIYDSFLHRKLDLYFAMEDFKEAIKKAFLSDACDVICALKNKLNMGQ